MFEETCDLGLQLEHVNKYEAQLCKILNGREVCFVQVTYHVVYLSLENWLQRRLCPNAIDCFFC